MRFVKPVRCSHVIQPGELLINTFDNKQCTETNPRELIRCQHCDNLFCLMFHWGMHLNTLQADSEGEDEQFKREVEL